jgi:trehalose 6-phosphate phosphatase
MEFKPTSVALHWRGREAGQVSRVRIRAQKYWSRLAEETGLQIHAFDGGLELRAPGRDKGSVVDELRAEAGDDVAIAYLGDDLTDEDAFRALGDDGLKVLVRAELRPTAADLWIVPPGELLEFLDAWIRATEARVGARKSD